MDKKQQQLSGVYAITDPLLLPDDTQMLERVEAALRGGLSVLQYRDKTADASKALRQARLLSDLCKSYDCLFIINDDPELARACEASGVHLGQGDASLQHARELLGNHFLIGRTCHNSLQLAEQAVQQGADYLAFGRCYPSKTKPDAPAAPLSIFLHTRHLQIPCVAIGGITPMHASEVVQAGASMIAAAEGIFAAADPCQAVLQYRKAFEYSPSFINEVHHDTLSRTF
ncbi:MAG: thiamine phosphate synthase [Marinospirillum sp.]|uniref:thiamine phosphate synthase n=1 Tax=Marinospirillum sp. TaxID=2183934 RepID=UPI001A09D0E4|nr:thiamine phosphate synthase [Marinospirillum sp.]MBE0505680.1 thiamine phosphate synthase [Marinospirillum sp.]